MEIFDHRDVWVRGVHEAKILSSERTRATGVHLRPVGSDGSKRGMRSMETAVPIARTPGCGDKSVGGEGALRSRVTAHLGLRDQPECTSHDCYKYGNDHPHVCCP